ncbi:hypothetical protein BX600DRAFT_42109 [Xylariales sp. PMI_506]|nr:hypothetical protein BX600DRAFT_42109 [Xylariales sp. PMI_506]
MKRFIENLEDVLEKSSTTTKTTISPKLPQKLAMTPIHPETRVSPRYMSPKHSILPSNDSNGKTTSTKEDRPHLDHAPVPSFPCIPEHNSPPVTTNLPPEQPSPVLNPVSTTTLAQYEHQEQEDMPIGYAGRPELNYIDAGTHDASFTLCLAPALVAPPQAPVESPV